MGRYQSSEKPVRRTKAGRMILLYWLHSSIGFCAAEDEICVMMGAGFRGTVSKNFSMNDDMAVRPMGND